MSGGLFEHECLQFDNRNRGHSSFVAILMYLLNFAKLTVKIVRPNKTCLTSYRPLSESLLPFASGAPAPARKMMKTVPRHGGAYLPSKQLDQCHPELKPDTS
ncbi:hypothetical protein Zmor_025426 [Zophobas morio]|uniref:Uncharacterized protein n=1 Tax=Zophobas morio TaxID=2755281 RepID=A0AA38HRY7_9CUCU|nr:hypothetical protein Zmor_025426 [Zophobas morio]